MEEDMKGDIITWNDDIIIWMLGQCGITLRNW
jgi:hypothetical protein